MKKTILLAAIILLGGCSIPTSAKRSEISYFSSEEKKLRGGFGSDATYEVITDFRGYKIYPEDVDELRRNVEDYISASPGLSADKINNLRKLKLTPGATKEETLLLLGEPTKISGDGNTWIYRINKLRTFTFFIIPVFIAHEGYYLRFDTDILRTIERHYPEQVMHQASGPGIIQSKE
jgi:hypothetical protein